jgi:hypothetical protein
MWQDAFPCESVASRHGGVVRFPWVILVSCVLNMHYCMLFITQVFHDWRNGRSLGRSRPTYCFVPSSSFSISVVAQLVRAYDQPVKSTSSLRWTGRRLSRLLIRLRPPRLASTAPKTSPQPRRWSPPPSRQQQEPTQPPRLSSKQPEYQPPGQIPDGPLRPRRQELRQPQLLQRRPACPSPTCRP